MLPDFHLTSTVIHPLLKMRCWNEHESLTYPTKEVEIYAKKKKEEYFVIKMSLVKCLQFTVSQTYNCFKQDCNHLWQCVTEID